MGKPYDRNHVLSSSLLERFQNKSGKLVRHDLVRNKTKLTSAGVEGYRKKLWIRTSAQLMEELWNREAEGKIGNVIQKIQKRSPLTLEEQKLLARFCAIHFVRSNEFIKLYERLATIRQSTLSMDPSLDFATRYMVRLGLLKTIKVPSAHFENAVKEYYFKTARYLEGHGIEIGLASGKRSLILPDGGFLIADVEGNRYQPSGGVALLQARQGIMPLAPNILLGFNANIKGVKYRALDDREVSNANLKLVKACHQYYYRRP